MIKLIKHIKQLIKITGIFYISCYTVTLYADNLQISNGVDVPKYKYPFFAVVQIKDQPIVPPTTNSHLQCGGALIALNWVITAKHCIDDDAKIRGLKVGVGSADLSDQSSFQVANVSKIIYFSDQDIDPLYSGNDITLLKLDRNINLTPIPLSNTKALPGTIVTVMGNGLIGTDEWKPAFAPVLQEANLPVGYDDYCFNYMQSDPNRFLNFIPSREICTGDGSSDIRRNARPGDSGSPLITTINGQYYLVGIVSRGSNRLNFNGPVIYTDITAYNKWIIDTINSN